MVQLLQRRQRFCDFSGGLAVRLIHRGERIVFRDERCRVPRNLAPNGDNGVDQRPIGIGVTSDGEGAGVHGPGLDRQNGCRDEQACKQNSDQERQIVGDRRPENHVASIMYPRPRNVLIDGPSGSSFLRRRAMCTSSAFGATSPSNP